MSGLDSFAALLPTPAPGATARFAAPSGAGESLAVAAWHRKHRRPVLWLTKDALSAAHAAEELAFFAPDIESRLLPDWEILPFARMSPAPDLQAARMAALGAMRRGGVTVAPASAALLPHPPPGFVAARAMKPGDKIDAPALIAGLAERGYARTDRVLAAGEFAVNGGHIDIFPPAAEQPSRLVLEDDEIEQIRVFVPQTQMSSGKSECLRLFPAGECDLSAAGIARFRRAFAARFGDAEDATARAVFRSEPAAGMEFFLPLFFERAARLSEYVAADALLVVGRGCRESLERFMAQARRRRAHAEICEHRPALSAEEVFLPPAALFESLSPLATAEAEEADGEFAAPPQVAINRRRSDSHAALKEFLRAATGRVILAADSVGRRDSLHAALSGEGFKMRRAAAFDECGDGISLIVAPLRGGFSLSQLQLTVLTEAEIFDVRLPPRRRRQAVFAAAPAEPLASGDAVIHRDYGVGRYAGTFTRTAGGATGEFLRIDYADEQRLWLPAAHLHLLSPYHGEPPALSKLGGGQWKRVRARAEKNARDTAARLLETQARRAAGGGIQHTPDDAAMARFADEFPFEETPDQAEVCRAVLCDMRAPKAMDRLVVADVGFGKTEVAMRAVCAAVLSGMQAAVLAPTTLLAEQHARSFADRFAGFPARLASLTRLSGAREKKRALEEIADGRADIVIGTHALLGKSAKFKRLGLAVIDEEHRFGVRQKEHFKTLRADVDVLALSATPIPRTMAMALEGVRDISVISTPPPQRLAVRTEVAAFSRELIADACERELLRGGQIYFVHNDIRGLPEIAAKLREWLPAMTVVVAHGGMRAAEIERAMRRFVRGEADMLLATSIVESGLDIANANTIVINRADRMGVSRLHQLRGRVGRAGAQAYAYLLTSPEGAATAEGKVRLDAVADCGALGDGLYIALRDLEARGAGEIFGERQSGDLAAVGYALYQKMVNAAVRQLSGGGDDIETTVELSAPALLPSDYAPAVGERLHYYRRLSSAADNAAIDAVRLEWEDRFGKPPPAALRLIACHKLRLLAGAAQAAKLRVRNGAATAEFVDAPKCREVLIQKIAAGQCRPSGGGAIVIDNLDKDPMKCAAQLEKFLRDLIPAAAPSTGHSCESRNPVS